MSGGERPVAHPDRSDDIAAYALGALGDADAKRLEAHLAGCEGCAAYLSELRPAVDLLAVSAPQVAPPPELRERLVATVRAEAERIDSAERSSSAAPASSRWRSWRGLAVRPATAMAAGAVLIAGVAAGWLAHGSGEPTKSLVAAHPTPAAPPGSVSASLAQVDGAATLRVERMPPLPGDDVYEVWTRGGGGTRPQSTFVPRRDGTANAAVPDLSGASAVLVTKEPHGGSAQPTSPPLLRAPLAG